LDIVADGAEADLEFSDLWKFRTKSGVLRLQELRVGRLSLRDVRADFGLWGEQDITISRVEFNALGGRVAASPFKYFLHQREVFTTLQVDDLDLARLRELVPGMLAGISGRVAGTLPIRVLDSGVRFDPGYLELQPGPVAELECSATALLRSGAMIPAGSLTVLKEAGSKPMRIRLGELRIDLRPPGLPLGCSARLHVAGEVPEGPVTFDLNVNGAIEKYLNVLTVPR
jgi:hypothetical protein